MRLPREASKVSFPGSLLLTVGAVGLIVAGTGITAAAAARLVRKIREQLVDQTLQHNGRLGLLNPAAFLEVGVRATWTEADVLAAQQALRLDTRKTVIRDLVVLIVDTQHHNRLEGLGVEVNLVHI